ncbi:MAG: hypothetical protein JOZ19_02605 [Rubrobacter sp.]|nr:hypothetical protein [Rubrobacter sp.]
MGDDEGSAVSSEYAPVLLDRLGCPEAHRVSKGCISRSIVRAMEMR